MPIGTYKIPPDYKRRIVPTPEHVHRLLAVDSSILKFCP